MSPTSSLQNRSEKATRIHEMFSDVAPRYDLLNDLISFGRLHAWRKECVRQSLARPGQSVLDLATGTGDLALEFKRKVGGSGKVLGTDFNEKMLDQAPAKAKTAGLEVEFELADATQLSYPDSNFDITSIAYGIRNVDRPDQAIREMCRVTRPGGRVMVLETGQSTIPGFRALFRFYFGRVMPLLAGLLGGNVSAYQYLQKSAGEFPSGEKFAELMRNNGTFESVTVTPLFFGVTYLYCGVKAGAHPTANHSSS